MTSAPEGFEPIPPLLVRPGLLDTVMYAAAMWEFQRLHFDAARAREEGLPGPIVQGPLLGAYLVRALTDHLPSGCELAAVRWRNRATVLVDEPLRCGGSIGPSDPAGARDAVLWIVDGAGNEVVTGSARLRPVTTSDPETR